MRTNRITPHTGEWIAFLLTAGLVEERDAKLAQWRQFRDNLRAAADQLGGKRKKRRKKRGD